MRLKSLICSAFLTPLVAPCRAFAFGPLQANCASIPDDIYEDNDTCETRATLVHGTHLNLHVKDSDEDYYSITLPKDGTTSIVLVSGAGDVFMVGASPASLSLRGLARPN